MCLPALPLGLSAPLLLPPPCSAGFLPSPAGMELGFRLQPWFWSRNPGCWAPLDDTLPLQAGTGLVVFLDAGPSSQLLELCEASALPGDFPLSLRSFTSHQGLVRTWLRHQQPGPSPEQTAQSKQPSSGHGASPSLGILWEPFPSSWSWPSSLSLLTAIPNGSAGLMELGVAAGCGGSGVSTPRGCVRHERDPGSSAPARVTSHTSPGGGARDMRTHGHTHCGGHTHYGGHTHRGGHRHCGGRTHMQEDQLTPGAWAQGR